MQISDYYRSRYLHFCDSLTDDRDREINRSGLFDLQPQIQEWFSDLRINRSTTVPAKEPELSCPALNLARATDSANDIFLIEAWTGNEPVKRHIGVPGKEVN